MDAAPGIWTRLTPWRQGHVLPSEALLALVLVPQADVDTTCAVVISHDCDLASANLHAEPQVELILGRKLNAINGTYAWGKAPRTLHLPMHQHGQEAAIELCQTAKVLVAKAGLATFEPDRAWAMDGRALGTLRSWLASRYCRAAFPDAFVNRMGASKATEKLAKALEPHGQLISSVFFDLDNGQNIERETGDPYQLGVVLAHVVQGDADEAAEQAEAVAEAVEKALHTRLANGADIVLKSCFAISEDDLPVSKARVLTQWRLEHMTNKADQVQPAPLQV
jgi:hypothetical protein